MSHERRFDVVVIGGGHAGTEAAAAAARMGAATALVTMSARGIGAMSCNPAIGGLGKGHLVREIDALDGLMARAIDRAGIQFRMLNAGKGPAVRGPRAQADRDRYAEAVTGLLARQRGLDIVEGEVADLALDRGGTVAGVDLADGRRFGCAACVVTTGTFLRGVIHRGEESWPAGRWGDRPAQALASTLERFGFALGRLKTGTPPRLDGRGIDRAAVEVQPGDVPPRPFSTLTESIPLPQIACHVTHTTPATHAIVRANLERSAVYGGRIAGPGPRYCPSIEDKVARFADRTSHRLFLEPEGLETATVYPNGISTSLPAEVQEALVATIPGLERVRVTRHGYAIEYDFVDPRELTHGLETRRIPGLFLAGQINGTTGYEEAAGQGLVAGLNAARHAGGGEPVVIDRGEAYLGVMIDDLVTRGVSEPYRMFTSRAEYRLLLRADNADLRLTAKGMAAGCVSTERARAFEARRAAVEGALAAARALSLTPDAARRRGLPVTRDGRRRTLLELAAHDGVDRARLLAVWPRLASWPEHVWEQVEIAGRYAGYLDRMHADIAAFRRDEALALPPALDYGTVGGLSTELREALARHRPATLGQAARIAGVTPAALQALLAHLHRPAA